jgi:FHA domain-containing protein
MWKLTVEDDEGVTRNVVLERDGYSIGRDETCDLCLRERNVSRQHAQLERDAEGRWWLVDLGATYGSFLNGQRVVGRTALASGDLVHVGDHWLGLVNDDAPAESVRSKAVGKRRSVPWDVREEPDRLLVFDGPDDGSKVRVDEGPVLIGVGAGVTIRLPEGAAPKGVHALLRPLPHGRYEIVRRSDALVLRVHLEPADRAQLDDGDLMCFETPGGAEVMALRFCAARRVRHSTTPSKAEVGVRARRRIVRSPIDPATLPSLAALNAVLRGVPLMWRLEGESLWPRPADYQAPPVRFTDLTGEAAGPTEVPGTVVPLRASGDVAARRGRWQRTATRVAAAVVLMGVAWGLGRRGGDPTPAAGVAVGPAFASIVPPAAAAPPVPSVAAADEARAPAEPNHAAGVDDPPAAPTPNRPNASAARSPASPRRPEAASPGDKGADSPERRRGLCRRYAESIARGNASPQIVQFHRTQCL